MKIYFTLLVAAIVASVCHVSEAADGVCVTTVIPDCLEYGTSASCVLCAGSKYPAKSGGATCVSCEDATDSDCEACEVDDNGATKCKTCPAGKVVKADGSGCEDCATRIDDCATCVESDDGVTCSDCTTDSKAPSATNTACVECHATCTSCNDAGNCLECATASPVKYPNGGQCDECGTAIDSCTTCTNDDGTTKCKACSDDKVPAADGRSCIACADRINDCTACEVTDGKVTCATCGTDTNKLSATSTACVACDASCTSCNDAGNCLECADVSPTKYPHGTICAECDTVAGAECTACENDDGTTKCTTCPSSNINNADDTQCEACSTHIDGCDTCSRDGAIVKCLTCSDPDNKELSDDSLACLACDDPTCDKCDKDGNCVECVTVDPPKYPDGSATCKVCGTAISGCDSCELNSEGETICVDCTDDDKYPALDGKTCDTCPNIYTDCKTCGYNADEKQTICTECTESDHVPSIIGGCCGLCAGVIGECSECSLAASTGVTSCTTCADDKDKSKDGTACVTCDTSDCKTCDDSEDCVECNSGYDLEGTECKEESDDGDGGDGGDGGDDDDSSCSLTQAGLFTSLAAALLGLMMAL